MTSHDWSPAGERFALADYRTTEHVVTQQAVGQVVDGDPLADEAEVRVLRREGFGAVLLVPVVSHRETVGLLEAYRRAARPWSATDVELVRLLAHQLSAVLSSPEIAAVTAR